MYVLEFFYKDIPIVSSLNIIVNEIFILRINYFFAISFKIIFVLKNEYGCYLFEEIGGS